jgi:glycosyltransferase involved in cell wall biosynthesis
MARSSPLISILMPVKNTEAFLEDCLGSILNQTYSNWELIAINDHSSDSSPAILNAFTEQDSRIKAIDNQGSGIIMALRLALQNSNGIIITRMDSDDLMSPDKLECMLSDLQEHGKGHIGLGKVKYFSEAGIGGGFARYEAWLNLLTATGANFTEIYKECVIPSPSWMVFKEDLLACNAFEEDRYPEDYDLAFRFYEKGLKCIPSTHLVHYWRDYDTRTSRTHLHYAENHFLALKLHYFIKLNYDVSRPLTLWGAGKKGKHAAKWLLENKIAFDWICDNPKKIGKDIYGQALLNFSHLESQDQPQCIVTVANTQALQQIKAYMQQQQLLPMQDYFMFC